MQAPKSRTLLIAAGAAGLLTFFAFAFRSQPLPVDVSPLLLGPMQVSIDEDGVTRVRDLFVLSAPVTGHLLRTAAEVGDSTVAGETVLARLTPADPAFLDARSQQQAKAAVSSAEAALGLAQAEHRRAQSTFEYARTDLIRARDLAQDGSLSPSDLEQVELRSKTAQANLDTAAAAVRVRRAELTNAQALLAPRDDQGGQLNELQLRAPASGRILRILQQSEGFIAAGTPILEIGDPGQLEIVVDLLSRDAVKVPPEATVSISNWGGDEPLAGQVRRVEPTGFTRVSALGIEEQRVNVIIDITAPAEQWQRLGHDFRVDASIRIWETAAALQIPNGALFRDAGEWACFVVVNDQAQLRRLTLGRNNGRSFEVLDGLAPDERVILHPSEKLADGSKVEQRQL